MNVFFKTILYQKWINIFFPCTHTQINFTLHLIIKLAEIGKIFTLVTLAGHKSNRINSIWIWSHLQLKNAQN